jgi:hypothetical protein
MCPRHVPYVMFPSDVTAGGRQIRDLLLHTADAEPDLGNDWDHLRITEPRLCCWEHLHLRGLLAAAHVYRLCTGTPAVVQLYIYYRNPHTRT